MDDLGVPFQETSIWVCLKLCDIQSCHFKFEHDKEI